MFLQVAQNLRKGIKDIVKGNKFIDFSNEEERKTYYEKVLKLNQKFISKDSAEFIAIRSTGSGWVSFKKAGSLELFKSAIEQNAEAKKLGIRGVYFDPEYQIKKDPPRMIFLKNFPPTWKAKQVYEFCKAYGEIEIEKEEDGKPKKDEDGNTAHKVYCEINSKTFEHFAKIVYARTSEAKQAIQALNQQNVEGF